SGAAFVRLDLLPAVRDVFGHWRIDMALERQASFEIWLNNALIYHEKEGPPRDIQEETSPPQKSHLWWREDFEWTEKSYSTLCNEYK
ncbi:hypothetical protein PFISCL1PPCAC_8018, partial [Pristionchus fissidentatus]